MPHLGQPTKLGRRNAWCERRLFLRAFELLKTGSMSFSLKNWPINHAVRPDGPADARQAFERKACNIGLLPGRLLQASQRKLHTVASLRRPVKIAGIPWRYPGVLHSATFRPPGGVLHPSCILFTSALFSPVACDGSWCTGPLVRKFLLAPNLRGDPFLRFLNPRPGRPSVLPPRRVPGVKPFRGSRRSGGQPRI